jgi:hypothetical protein
MTHAFPMQVATPSPLVPTNVGTQGRPSTLFRPEASILFKAQHRSWIPTFVGMSGDGSVENVQ